MERLARVITISEKTKRQDLMSDGGKRFIDEDFDEQKVMSLRTSAIMTGGNELMEEPVKAGRPKRGGVWGKNSFVIIACFNAWILE